MYDSAHTTVNNMVSTLVSEQGTYVEYLDLELKVMCTFRKNRLESSIMTLAQPLAAELRSSSADSRITDSNLAGGERRRLYVIRLSCSSTMSRILKGDDQQQQLLLTFQG